MRSLGQTGSAMPKVKPGDYDRALALLAATGADKKTREYLLELQGAAAAHDKARADAEVAESKAAKRESEAQAAAAAATVARQALADDTAKAHSELNEREKVVVARERKATEVEAAQDARDKDLARREDHLRKAGVAGF